MNSPSSDEYVRGLTLLGLHVKDTHKRLFQAHYQAKERSATAKQLAEWTTITGGHAIVNAFYGKLGHAFCDALDIKPRMRHNGTYSWWSIWFIGWEKPDGFVWEMRPEFAEALEKLGWVNPTGFVSPDEVTMETHLIEGATLRVVVNAYERNGVARRQCIEAHGVSCSICGFNFGKAYGPEAEGYIHVHHIRPLSDIGHDYIVNPVADLLPVCPNCHAVLHLDRQCKTIEEVRQLLQDPPPESR